MMDNHFETPLGNLSEFMRHFNISYTEKGKYRQIAMDMLYRVGGMKGEEIGRLFGSVTHL